MYPLCRLYEHSEHADNDIKIYVVTCVMYNTSALFVFNMLLLSISKTNYVLFGSISSVDMLLYLIILNVIIERARVIQVFVVYVDDLAY